MKKLYRHSILALTISMLIALSFAFFYYSKSISKENLTVADFIFSSNTYFAFFMSLLIYGANYFSSVALDKVLLFLHHKLNVTYNFWTREAMFFANGILVSLLSYFLFSSFLLKLFYGTPIRETLALKDSNLSGIFIIVLISIFILVIVFVFSLYDQIKNLDIQNKQITMELQKIQIQSMKEQLSPHFLFNNLNVLISTIQEDPLKAERFARSFSRIYRYVLDQIEVPVAKLSLELGFAKDYLYLLNVRYDDAIDLEISEDIRDFEEYLLPTLSLQIVLENIVKHNAIPSNKKMKIRIGISETNLVVCNEKLAKPLEVDSLGTGLSNLNKRYRQLWKKEIAIEDTQDLFCVKLPLQPFKS